MQRYQLNRASNLVIKEFQDVYGGVETNNKGDTTPVAFRDYR